MLILTPREMSEAHRQEVATLVSAWSGGLSGPGRTQDFRVAGRPFILWFGCDFAPQGQVGLAAMCNQTVDHILLATLASRLSTVLEGIVLLDGELRVDEATRAISGLTAIGENYHAATADFMHHWIESPSFRLPK